MREGNAFTMFVRPQGYTQRVSHFVDKKISQGTFKKSQAKKG